MKKLFCVLFKKDIRMMLSGKFFFIAFGSLVIYTLFINFGYVNFMNDKLYNVYVYDPEGTRQEASGAAGKAGEVKAVASREELDAALSADTNGVGIDASLSTPKIVMYAGSEKVDRHRADYARSLLVLRSRYSAQPYPRSGSRHSARVVGTNTRELKQKKEMCCELLFIEIVAVGFLGIASVLFKEKQMGVIRVHAILPLKRSLFILAKLAVFLLSDLVFAVLMTALNVGINGAGDILPAMLVQTGILSIIMALTGFGCAMLLPDFRQFSLAYLVIAVFASVPVFLSANTSVKMAWIDWHPFYQIYMGLKGACFGTLVVRPSYYILCACGIGVLFAAVWTAFRREMGKEG